MDQATNPQLSFDFGTDHVAANDPAVDPLVRSTRLFKRLCNPLYLTPEWQAIRKVALRRAHFRCEKCTRTFEQQIRLEVHHVVPVAIRPDWFLHLSNLQVLCEPCHQTQTMQHAARHGWQYA